METNVTYQPRKKLTRQICGSQECNVRLWDLRADFVKHFTKWHVGFNWRLCVNYLAVWCYARLRLLIVLSLLLIVSYATYLGTLTESLLSILQRWPLNRSDAGEESINVWKRVDEKYLFYRQRLRSRLCRKASLETPYGLSFKRD